MPGERGGAFARDDAAPQQVPQVGRHGVDLVFVAVETHGVVAAPFVDPEVPVERLAQPIRVGAQPVGEGRVGQRPVGEFGQAQLRVVRVALDLAGGDRQHRQPAVSKPHPVPGVPPTLVTQPFGRAGGVLHVAVAVPVAVVVDPAQRGERVVAQLADQVVVPGPAPVLRQQDQPELGGVGAAVVGVVGHHSLPGQLAEADLVQDLAGLLVGEVDAAPSLMMGEREQGPPGQPRPEGERLVRGDQGVPSEEGEEPGHPGGREADPLLPQRPSPSAARTCL